MSGFIEQIPAGVQKGENAGLLTEVENLLSQSNEALLEPAVAPKSPEILKALCAMGMDEPLAKLTDKMLNNLHQPGAGRAGIGGQNRPRFRRDARLQPQRKTVHADRVLSAYDGGIGKRSGRLRPYCGGPAGGGDGAPGALAF